MLNDLSKDIFSNLKKFRDKQVTAENAIKTFIKPGDRIFIDSGCSEPLDLTKKLIELGQELPDVEILHFLSLSDLDYYETAGNIENLN
ncbi:MAG: hypothetical protein EU529_00030 [Promethearchaeota archaeon]|nr:MAG: hypothetical protein EU529_00030 [Candidatus Lokiarchaeota archaeon]